jgi:glycosyltransferase 2 family protein
MSGRVGRRPGLLLLLRVLITGALLVAIFVQLGGLHAIGASLLALPAPVVVGVLAFTTLDRMWMAAKWLLLLPRSAGCRIGLWTATAAYCTSLLYGLFLPATVGADAVRISLCVRRGLRAQAVVVSVVLERLVGCVALLALNAAVLTAVRLRAPLPDPANELLAWIIGGLLTGVGLIALVLARPELGHAGRERGRLLSSLRRLHATWHSHVVPAPRLLLFFLATIGEQLFAIAPVWLILQSAGVAPDLATIAVATTLAQLAARLPVSIGGLGVQEASLAYVLVRGGVPPELALLAALAVRVLETLCCIPWWLALRSQEPAAAQELQSIGAGSSGPAREHGVRLPIL